MNNSEADYNYTLWEKYIINKFSEEFNATAFNYSTSEIEAYNGSLSDDIFIYSESTQFFKTTAIVFGSLFILILYKNLAEKRKNKVYDTLNLTHVVFGMLHAILINVPVDTTKGDPVPSELICILELGVPMWTVCVSLKMFTDLYLFQNRNDVYSAQDLTIFGFSSIATVYVYELFFIMLGEILIIDANYASAIRLICVLLTMSLPMAIACIVIKSLCSKSSFIVKPLGSFLLFHLLVFVLCDVCVAFYMIAKTTDQEEWVVDVSTSLLYYRLLLEVGWFVGSHYLGKVLRIYKD